MSEYLNFEDIYKAYEDCRRRKKDTKGAKKFEVNALYNLQRLIEDIDQRKYNLSRSQCFIINEPVTREVFCASFRDRVVHHFIFNELNPIIEKCLVNDTCSCRVNKGTDYAISRVGTFIRRETNNYYQIAYFLKVDLSGFFMSIDRKLLLDKIIDLLKTRYTGPYKETLLYLLPIIILTDVTLNTERLCPEEMWETLPQRKTLFGNDRGLPIGNLCSQLFANYYLNDIDHVIKSKHRCYSRYVDDIIIVDRDIEKLKKTLELIESMARTLRLKINPDKTTIGDVRNGIPYLGVTVYPHYTMLGKKRIGRIYKKGREFESAEKAYVSMSSRKGMFERYHGRRLAKRWYYSMPPRITRNLKRCGDLKYTLIS